MPKETVLLTEREVEILSLFVKAKILNDKEIAQELADLVKKLRS